MRDLPPYIFKAFSSRVSGSLERTRNALLSLCFPWPCSVCGALQAYPKVLCETCRQTLPRIGSRCCKICGSPFPDRWRVPVCPECKRERPKLTRIRSAFLYEGPVIQMIREMKFSRRARHVRYFAEELYPLLLSRLPGSIEAIVPVPLHRTREWERTFDQAALLAKNLHELSGLPLRNALIRTKNTISQTSLSGPARRRNLRNAFQLKKGVVLPRAILLIDDVITTGATMESCASLLRRAGARKIYGLTIARAPLK